MEGKKMKETKERVPMRLQFFAEENDEGNQEPTNLEDEEGTTTEIVEEKTFKQEDVNNIVAKESKKATEKLLKELGIEDFEGAKDGLVKFRKWQDDQKTEQELVNEKVGTLETSNNDLSSENATLKAQLSATKQGVKADSLEDVVALAERLVTEEVTIDEAIKQVVEKYPHFTQVEEKDPDSPKFVIPGNPKGGENGKDDPFAAAVKKFTK